MMRTDDRVDQSQFQAIPPPHVADEFGMLMSMALDDLLDDDERARFDDYLERYPSLAAEWQSWQYLAGQFHATPSALAPDGFVAKFEVKLIQHERRRRLWWGMAVGSVAVVLWILIFAGAAALGAYVLFNQPGLLTEFVHSIAYGYTAVVNWFDAVFGAANAVINTRQARNFVLAYVAASAGLLVCWFYLLRRTTRPVDVSATL